MTFDVVRALESCYADAADDRRWLEGVLDSLSPLDDGAGMCAFTFAREEDGSLAIRCEAGTGTARRLYVEIDRLITGGVAAETILEFFAPNPPATYALRRATRALPALARSMRRYLRHRRVEDTLGICATAPDGGTTLVVMATTLGRPLLPPRTLHQLVHLSAHLNSAMRLRNVAVGDRSPRMPHGAEAVIDVGGRVIDAVGSARGEDAQHGLAAAVRRMERARGSLRRSDPEEAVALWQGLVDGQWSLVDHCDTDGRRYLLARRNPPGIRDPKALTPRERAVLAYAAMGRQNKYIGYLLGLSEPIVSGDLMSARKKLGASSRADLIQRFAPLVRVPEMAATWGHAIG